jgi:dihydrofolate synthase
MLSSGPTRKEVELSEAQSYCNVARCNKFFDIISDDAETVDRILIENRALDSYHNVLFSLTLFKRACNAWPQLLTIISHNFKRTRLVDGHCAAIGFPLDRVRFIGIDPFGMIAAAAAAAADPSSSGALEENMNEGDERAVDELKRGALEGARKIVDLWAEDPHGRGDELAGKRIRRNPWALSQEIFLSDEERQASGLVTKKVKGGGETLVGDAPRPWL